jgi:phytanoyl-CoA hydroxylase
MTGDYGTLRAAFRQDGFIHVELFFEPGESQELEANLTAFIRDIAPTLPKADAMYEDYGNPETLKYIGHLEISPYFAAFMAKSKVRELAEALLEEKVTPEAIQFFDKPPRRGTPTPPHQDGFYHCIVPNVALTVWIPLDDVDQENGALHYWKHSHRLGVLPHNATYVLGFSEGLAPNAQASWGEETICCAKRGDCLIHHSLTIHATGSNTSPRSRRAIGIEYYGESAKIDREAERRHQESVAMQQKSLLPRDR